MAATASRTAASHSFSSTSPTMVEREVMDPVTHRRLTIHDNTSGELPRDSFQDTAGPDSTPSVVATEMTALLSQEVHNIYWQYPEFERQYRKRTALVVVASAFCGGVASLIMTSFFRVLVSRNEFWTLAFGGAGCTALALVSGLSVLQTKVKPPLPPPEINGRLNQPIVSHRSPETAAWLNSFLSSLWPIINPTIFTSVSDMLEDAVQGSLPKFIHGVRVADIGQGSEPLRILAIRHLKEDAAGAERGEMEGQEGDFVNLELAIAYRAQDLGGEIKGRARNVHLLLEFYTTASVVLPVWVEITGIIATTRLRLQLTPNPPFLAAMTMTFLGQPKVTLECTPLSKGLVNVMDVPGLSKLLQTAIDGAIGAFVAPRSLNLDLKAMLSGKDKMDTDAVGVLVVTVKSAVGLRKGDEGRVWAGKDKKQGDPFVSVGWGKWGKAMWSTRIIENELNPVWNETSFILVTPAETNAREQLKLQVWDSDRFSADDLLGTVEVPLTDIMSASQYANTTALRKDTFNDGHPGSLEWSVGYMSKTTLQHHIADARDLTAELRATAEVKLREAKANPVTIGGIDRQKDEDLKEMTDEILARTRPSSDWPSGIISVRVEQITGLEIPTPRDSGTKGNEEEEESKDLPNAYCSIIINHERVYRTRTKMKSSKPYFNAGTERFVKNWMEATVIISVRDLRQHEINPLVGVLVLPLSVLLKDRAQVTDSLPLVGGIGFGKLRFSVLWRSVQAKLPLSLLGWDACTVELQAHAKANIELPPDLATYKLRFKLGRQEGHKVKMYPDNNGGWNSKANRPLALPTKNRYADCLVVEFRKRSFGPDSTEAWGVFWLQGLNDNEETTVTILLHARDDDQMDTFQKNILQEENVIGQLQVKVKIWPGLSGYHRKLARDPNMTDVMDTLDESVKDVSNDNMSYDSDSVSDSSAPSASSSHALDGIREQFKRKDELHKQHRGLMQWSGMRKLEWIGRNIDEKKEVLERKMKGKLQHQQMEREVEREA